MTAPAPVLRRINHDVDVQKTRLVSDTDTQAVQRAFNLARAASDKKRVVLPIDYTLATTLDVTGLNGMVIEAGDPYRCAQKATTALNYMIRANGAVQDLTLRGLGVRGGGVDDATAPRRGRTWNPGIGTSVFMRGDLAPLAKLTAAAASGATVLSVAKYVGPGSYLLNGTAITVTNITGTPGAYSLTLSAPLAAPHVIGEFVTVNYQIRNIRLEHCYLENLLWGSNPAAAPELLPAFFAGIRGTFEAFDVHTYNTMDFGLVYNEHVIIDQYKSEKSADNGLSISRGNKRVEATNINITDPAYFGVWIAGFEDDLGPEHVLLSNISVKNCGKGGIWADGAPKRGVITNFNIDQGYHRGPSDAPSDAECVGVFLGGYPQTDRPAPLQRADGWRISNGLVERAPRAAVMMNGVGNVVIDGVSALDIGTQFLADGTTPVASGDLTQNIAFLLDQPTASTRVTIKNTDTNDTRAVPYCNQAIQPLSSSFLEVGPGNTMKGCRNPFNIVETSPDPLNINRGQIYLQNTKHTQGATAGSSAGTGTLPGFDFNGAAGSGRYNNFQTATVQRWREGVTGDAESAPQNGSNYAIGRYTNAGVFIDTPIFIDRATGQVRLLSAPARLFSATTANRPTPAVAGVGGHMFDTTLGKPIWSDGTNWKDATGATV